MVPFAPPKRFVELASSNRRLSFAHARRIVFRPSEAGAGPLLMPDRSEDGPEPALPVLRSSSGIDEALVSFDELLIAPDACLADRHWARLDVRCCVRRPKCHQRSHHGLQSGS